MGLFIWSNQPSKIFVWDTPISKVFLWDTQVRPTWWQAEYQEVEYIQSSWTQYFILWNQFKTSYKSVIDLQLVTTWGDHVPLGTRDRSYRYWIDVWWWYFTIISGGSSWTNTVAENTNRHSITIDKTTAIVDGNNYSISYVDRTINYGLGVFCYNDIWNAGYMASMKMYKLDIYDENWVHIYDLVPCYRKSDDEVWMYDLVNDQFYTNAWSWAFTIPTLNSLQNINLTPTNEINITPNNNGSGNVQSI
jgi:hypothetical protein